MAATVALSVAPARSPGASVGADVGPAAASCDELAGTGQRADGAAGYAAQVWAGLTIPIFGVIHAALFVLLLFSIVSLVNTHAILGWPAPPDIPLWGGILMLIAAYIVVSSPLHAIRQASFAAYHPTYPFAAWGGLLWIAFVVSFGWLAYQYLPEVRQFLHNLPAVWESFRFR
jgi:hypothetical protein